MAEFREPVWRVIIGPFINFMVMTVIVVAVIAEAISPFGMGWQHPFGAGAIERVVDGVLAATAVFAWRRLTTRQAVAAWARRYGWQVEDPRQPWPWRKRLPGKTGHTIRLAVPGSVGGWPGGVHLCRN